MAAGEVLELVTDEALELARGAREASLQLALHTTEQKNEALELMAKQLESDKDAILVENQRDLEQGEIDGLSTALLDRLKLTDQRFASMVQGLRDLIALPDPVGKELSNYEPPSGINISKVRVPIGVIAIIYESRPNVTADAAGLCVKTSNVVILRGGKEARYSNQLLTH